MWIDWLKLDALSALNCAFNWTLLHIRYGSSSLPSAVVLSASFSRYSNPYLSKNLFNAAVQNMAVPAVVLIIYLSFSCSTKDTLFRFGECHFVVFGTGKGLKRNIYLYFRKSGELGLHARRGGKSHIKRKRERVDVILERHPYGAPDSRVSVKAPQLLWQAWWKQRHLDCGLESIHFALEQRVQFYIGNNVTC